MARRSPPGRRRRSGSPLLGCLLLACSPAARHGGEPLHDVTAETGLVWTHDNGMSGELYFAEVVGPGGALWDYDRDGDLDAYLVQGGPLDETAAELAPNRPSDRLFRSDLLAGEKHPRLRFVEVTERARIHSTGYGMGVATGDVNHDGWTDFYVTNFGPNQLWLARGDGTFREATPEAAREPRWSTSAAFLDYDLDGWLDLFVTNYVDFRLARHRTCFSPAGVPDYCGPGSYEPESALLLRNLGGGALEDVSGPSGILALEGSGLGVVAGDFDDDGWPDLYVANDLMPNRLWINQRDGTFRDDALLAGCAVSETGAPQASMGVVAADLDEDGDEDLFMTHLDTETNTAYRNDGGGLFTDTTSEWRLGEPSVGLTGFGVAALDLENDGRLDLAIANGAVKRIAVQIEAGDPLPLRQPGLLLRNEGGARFAPSSSPALERPVVGRGLAPGDVDNDGDGDLLVLANGGPARLLENRWGQEARWIGARLHQGPGQAALAGSRSWIGCGATRSLRTFRSATSYLSAGDERILAAVSGGCRPSLEVRTPRGRRVRFLDLPAERYFNLFVGEPL